MTLLLERGTKPNGLGVKTVGLGEEEVVYLGNYEISLEDFLMAAYYVLTNTNLREDDPRRQFVDCVCSMQEAEGWNGGELKRLRTDVLPIPIIDEQEDPSDG